jgi:peptide methionine sulfoxide reductase MsrA
MVWGTLNNLGEFDLVKKLIILQICQLIVSIVLFILSLSSHYYPAEQSHQNFIAHNPTYPYVVVHDLPKLNLLRQQFPDLVSP